MDTIISTDTFDRRFADLVARWVSHEDLRHAAPDIADLAESRLALDRARSRIRELVIAA
jgi:hypothetical protein